MVLFPGHDGTPLAPKLSDWIKVYDQLISQRRLMAKTLSDKRLWLSYLDRYLGGKAINEIRPSDIVGVAREVAAAGKETTARRIVIEAKDVFNEAVMSDLIFRNPAEAVRPIRPKIRRMRLTPDNWNSMHASCKPGSTSRRLLRLALVSAQRRADLAAMRFDQVHDGHLWVHQLKTGRKIAIPLDIGLPKYGLRLSDVIEECGRESRGSQFILPRRTGVQSQTWALSYDFVKVRDRVIKASDIPIDRTPPSLHEVRSLAERLYREEGVDTQTLLGHKFPSTTNLYNDDRGLSSGHWKFVKAA